MSNRSGKHVDPALNRRIGDAVRSARVARGVTQEELAKILGVDRVTVARYELGMRTLTVPTLFTILEYLEIPMPGLQVEELGQNRKAVTGAASPAVQRIVQTLEKRPDLLPSVEELLDTMLED